VTGPYRHDPAHIRALAVTAVQMLETDPTLSVHGVAANLGIPHSAVYTAWRRINPDHPPRGKGRISPQMRKAAALPFATLCDVMLDHVPRKPAAANEIFTATLRDYGDCCERRLFRALRRLIDTGRVERVGEIYTTESTYRRRTTTMSKKIDRELLKRTATAATQDEWQWQDDGDAIEGKRDGQIVLYVDGSEADDGPVVVVSAADRAHIAAASPPVVLALLERLEELERALDGALALADEPERNQDAKWEAARKAHEETLRKGTVLS
jgi:hypothetical protein